jgi:transposase
MGKQQKTYTREFKLEAVQLVKSSGKPMSQIARELGISDSALSRWCQQLAEQGDQAFPGSGHQTAQEEELRRLKRELEITRQECDILKRGMPLRGTNTNETGYTWGVERSQPQNEVFANSAPELD